MEKNEIPIIIYDNRCYSCMKFIKIIDFFTRGKFRIEGHYSKFGEKIRKDILDESALDMFWLIDKKNAFGGRAALFPLIKLIFSKKIEHITRMGINEECQQECKTMKEVIKRATSVFSNSKIIKLQK